MVKRKEPKKQIPYSSPAPFRHLEEKKGLSKYVMCCFSQLSLLTDSIQNYNKKLKRVQGGFWSNLPLKRRFVESYFLSLAVLVIFFSMKDLSAYCNNGTLRNSWKEVVRKYLIGKIARIAICIYVLSLPSSNKL